MLSQDYVTTNHQACDFQQVDFGATGFAFGTKIEDEPVTETLDIAYGKGARPVSSIYATVFLVDSLIKQLLALVLLKT